MKFEDIGRKLLFVIFQLTCLRMAAQDKLDVLSVLISRGEMNWLFDKGASKGRRRRRINLEIQKSKKTKV